MWQGSEYTSYAFSRDLELDDASKNINGVLKRRKIAKTNKVEQTLTCFRKNWLNFADKSVFRALA